MGESQYSQKEAICNRLRDENHHVGDNFAEILADIQDSFDDREVSHTKVVNYLAVKTRKSDWINKLKKMSSIEDLFTVLIEEGCNWLNYHYLDIVTSRFGSDIDKAKMTDYVKKLWLYLQRSLYEIPPEFVKCHQKKAKVFYHFVIPVDYGNNEEKVTGEDVKLIQKMLADALDLQFEDIHIEVQRGSIILHFLIDEQLLDLEYKKVLLKTVDWLKCDNQKSKMYFIQLDQIRSNL